jgi:hypothetical protein
MNNTVLYFRDRLRQINHEALSSPITDLAPEMAKATQRLRSEYGDISRGVANQQGIAIAVINYLRAQQLATYRDIKYVCFGVTSPYGIPLTRVIEHETLFPKLLEQVVNLQSEPRKFRRCYQGLLKGYLRYPGLQTDHVIGRSNWLLLRDFLTQHCKSLQKQKPVMEWTKALNEHRNLLGEEPCKPYGKALLDGDMSVVEELKNRLGIDDDTWVMNELVLSHIQAATALKDEPFKLQVMPLVQLLEKHPLLITRGLALLLKRYEACQESPEHHTLRDAALREWKSPWLEANKPFWYAQVGEGATEMVSLWLKKRTIRDFFELLQADGHADRQRMEFWLQYAEQIDDIWLALGQHSLYNNKPDYKRIRQNMAGRYMALEGGTYTQDNAFLMRINGYVFIEFGKQNNACHVFDADNLPFTLGQKSVLGTQEGLKNTYHSGHREKLTHREGWQWDFANFLRSYAQADPGEKKPKAVAASSRRSTAAQTRATTTPTNSLPSHQLDIKGLRVFCDAHKLPIEDHRDKGGALWVRASETDPVASAVLKTAGFRFKKGRGWWLA